MKKVNVPEGISGNWKIDQFTVSEREAMIAMLHHKHRTPSSGKYTRLMHYGEVVMSDTDAEMRDHWQTVKKAKGHILINGLGLGMVLLNCMMKPKVERATVIELSEDVIRLVAPHYQKMYGNRLEVIQADAMTWQPPKGVRYGMVWHDIWTYICGDNYEQMKTLHRRYERIAEWQDSWCRHEMKKLAVKKHY